MGRGITRMGPRKALALALRRRFAPSVTPRRTSTLAVLLGACFLSAASTATAQLGSAGDRVPLGDLVEVVVLDDEILAIDAEAGGTLAVSRRVGEDVLWTGTRGLLAVVITDQRLLAVATGAASWQEVDYQRGESPPGGALLGDRVALVTLRQRVLGFVGPANRFSELRLGPHQRLRATRVGANVAVVVTSRDAHGLSSSAGGFFPVGLQVREDIERVEAGSNVATLHTDQRVLVFRSPTATWSERRN